MQPKNKYLKLCFSFNEKINGKRIDKNKIIGEANGFK